MNRTRLAIGFLVLVIALTACSRTVETSISTSPWQDITPPELIEVSLDLSEVDVSGEDREITVTARVTDDLSGVDLAEFHFVGPTMRQEATATLESVLFGLITDGEFVGNLTLPRYSEAGTWRLERVSVVDHVGNRREYDPDALAFLGPSTSIEVTTMEEDLTVPELVELSIDHSEGVSDPMDPYVITDFVVQATDNLSGVKSVRLYLEIPATGDREGKLFDIVLNGPRPDGTFSQGIVRHIQFRKADLRRVAKIEIDDNVGNRRTYLLNELTSLGLSTFFEVAGTSMDITAARVG